MATVRFKKCHIYLREGMIFDQLTTQGKAEIAMSDVPTGYKMYNELQARDKDLFNGDMHLVMVDAV